MLSEEAAPAAVAAVASLSHGKLARSDAADVKVVSLFNFLPRFLNGL